MEEPLQPKIDAGSFPEPVRVSLPSPNADAFTGLDAGRRIPAQMEKSGHRMDMPSAMRHQPATDDPLGMMVTQGGGTGGLAGAFWTQYVDELGDTYLQGGSVTGGNGGSHSFEDYKVSDADTGLEKVAGTILYVEVACEATVSDGIMLPGCAVAATGSDWGTHATDLPANDAFTAAYPTGSIYREIGRWSETAFLPSGSPGNLLADGCIGNFQISVA